MTPIVEIIRLSKQFNKQVLADINFTLFAKQTLGLIGRNGAGKTTLIRIILGFLNPTSGTVRISGQPPGRISGQIGYLPEKPDYHLLFSGEEYLTYLAHLSAVNDPEARVTEVLALVGMGGRAAQRMNRYSKGMLQRIGLAQALLPDPQLLILDEPMSGLDPAGQKDFRDMILQLQAQGKSILLCSHMLEELERVCTNIAIIEQGRIIRQESIDRALIQQNRYRLRVEGLSGDLLAELGAAFAVTQPEQGTLIYNERVKGEKEKLLKILIEQGAAINALIPGKKTLEEYYLLSIEEAAQMEGGAGK